MSATASTRAKREAQKDEGDPLKEIRALVRKYVATPDIEIAKSIDEKLKSFRDSRLIGGWTDRNVTTLLLDIARY